jgi:hypothetical protein
MASLTKEYIIDLYSLVDDLLPEQQTKTGRPQTLSDSETVTILIWHSLIQRDKTLKEIHDNLSIYHKNEFDIPSYQTFVRRSHECFPLLFFVLSQMLSDKSSVRLMDSTFLPVCKLARMDSHKTAKGVAQMGKNHQGWHYGFKLHASVDERGRFAGIFFTPANVHDIHGMSHILNENCQIAVGDTLYGAKVMGRKIFEEYGTVIIAPPHPKQKRKIATDWQNFLLSIRSKIESVFDILKEHMHLVSSFPRSIRGYFLHYVRILIGYQLSRL